MKKCTEELKEFLHTAKEFYMCDLYEFTLTNGMVLRYADYDLNINFENKTYLSNGPIFERDKISVKLGADVDSMNIDMSVDSNDSIGTRTFIQAAHIGAFDDGNLKLTQCYMSSPGVVVGILDIFEGEIEVKDGGGLSLSIEAKSSVQRLNVDYPLRNYYVGCPFSVYGKECGVNIDNFKTVGIVGENSTAVAIYTTLVLNENYFENGGICFTSGNLTGVTMPIKSNSTNCINLMTECVGTPAKGDNFYIYPGCDKTNSMCANRFNNSNRNRSTPFVPLPEAVV